MRGKTRGLIFCLLAVSVLSVYAGDMSYAEAGAKL
jgi:hypothetical protein